MTLTASRGKVYLFDGKEVVALSREDGSLLWKSAELPVWKQMADLLCAEAGGAERRGDVRGGRRLRAAQGKRRRKSVRALHRKRQSALDGQASFRRLSIAGRPAGDRRQDVGGERHQRPERQSHGNRRDPGPQPRYGKGRKKYDDIPAYWFHHRCYPAKATEDYLIMSRTGTEFVDLKTGQWTLHHWVRGACLYGIMPANGLLYAPQHPCSCYIGAKMYGFTALAPAYCSQKALQPVADDQRLITADAAAAAFPKQRCSRRANGPPIAAISPAAGWFGGISAPTKMKWSVKLPGPLTQPVIADQKVLVADKNNPVLCALDAGSGQPRWRFIPAGGSIRRRRSTKGWRISAATDGLVYCLDLASGALRWKYQAAPALANHMYLEHMEATHPVHGNVLVMNNRVYTVAGRSMFTDGGIHFLILDAFSGRKIKEHLMDDKMPGSKSPCRCSTSSSTCPWPCPICSRPTGRRSLCAISPSILKETAPTFPLAANVTDTIRTP